MSVTTHRFLLRLPHMGREISDLNWNHIEPEAARQIIAIQDYLNKDVVVVQGRTYSFTFDFKAISASYLEYHRRQSEFQVTKDLLVWSYYDKGRCDCFVECKVTANEEPSAKFDHADSILRYIVYNVFIAMCISVPGLFNLAGGEIIDIPEQRSIRGTVITYDLDASAHLPENYHYELEEQSWLPVAQVDATQVMVWLDRTLPQFAMVGDNPASRCALALLHLCRSDPYSGAGAAWLFNGLEALFGCKPGENRSALIRRIGSLLELNADAIKHLKSTITELYNLRSAFVHGGLATLHPVRDESIDSRIDDELLKIMKAMDRGITLYIAVLKKVISLGMDWPQFEERMVR